MIGTAGSNGQTVQGTIMSLEWTSLQVFHPIHSNLDHSSTDREQCFTCPSLGYRKAGPLISSACQAALFTEMSGCTMAKDNGQGNNVHHMQQVHISDRKAESHGHLHST